MKPDHLHDPPADTPNAAAGAPADLADEPRRRPRRRTRTVTIVAASVVLVVAAIGVATLLDRSGGTMEVAGPGGTTPPAPGQSLARIALGANDHLRAFATGRGRPGVWALTTRNGSNGNAVTVWHYDARSGAARRWPTGSVGIGPSAFAVCTNRVWYAAGGEYGGDAILTSLDPATGDVADFTAPVPKGDLPPGMPTGIEGPGRIPSIACDQTDSSVLFTRSYWPAWWRLDPHAGSFTQHRLADRMSNAVLANDGTGQIAIGMYRPSDESMSQLLIVDTKSQDTSLSDLSSAVVLVGTADGFLAVGAHGAQLVATGASRGSHGSQRSGAGFTFPTSMTVNPSVGAGLGADGRLVLFDGAGLVYFDPSNPGHERHVPLEFDDCAPPDPADSMKLPPGCVTSSASVAVDDTGNVFVNNPRTNTVDQVG